MSRCRVIWLFSIVMLGSGCAAAPLPDVERNKALALQYMQEIDASSDIRSVIEKWTTPDYKGYINSTTPIDRAGYQELASSITKAFSGMRHDIQYTIAEGDRVVMGITLHLTHTGEFQGIAATGRQISIEEIVVFEVKDGKFTTEWAVVDFAGLQQQLTAPAAPTSN